MMSLPWALTDSLGLVMSSSVCNGIQQETCLVHIEPCLGRQKEHCDYLPTPSVTTLSLTCRCKLLFDAICTKYASHSAF